MCPERDKATVSGFIHTGAHAAFRNLSAPWRICPYGMSSPPIAVSECIRVASRMSTDCIQSCSGGSPPDPKVSFLNRKPNRNDIHAELREQIILLDLPPGSRLREEHLAEHFGVSRTPIRQVLDRLEFEGLVEQGDGRGARVSSLDPKEIRDIWAMRLRIAEMVGDFLRIPKGEEILGRLAAIRSGLADVKETKDLRELGALYNRFHEAMLTLISNQALVRIHDLLYVQTARVWMQFLPEMDIDREIDVMAEEVGEAVAALAEGTLQDVAAVRAEHMRRLLNRFNQHVTTFPAVPA